MASRFLLMRLSPICMRSRRATDSRSGSGQSFNKVLISLAYCQHPDTVNTATRESFRNQLNCDTPQ